MKNISLSVDPSVNQRVLTIREAMKLDPIQSIHGSISKSHILRIALAYGLAHLEKKYGIEKVDL